MNKTKAFGIVVTVMVLAAGGNYIWRSWQFEVAYNNWRDDFMQKMLAPMQTKSGFVRSYALQDIGYVRVWQSYARIITMTDPGVNARLIEKLSHECPGDEFLVYMMKERNAGVEKISDAEMECLPQWARDIVNPRRANGTNHQGARSRRPLNLIRLLR